MYKKSSAASDSEPEAHGEFAVVPETDLESTLKESQYVASTVFKDPRGIILKLQI